MTFDFDHEIDRRGTDCLKYDFAAERGKPEGVLPLWVADMDFPAPPCVLDKLHGAVRHGILPGRLDEHGGKVHRSSVIRDHRTVDGREFAALREGRESGNDDEDGNQ